MLNSGKNSAQTLFYEAKRYKTYGWSVIPLRGGTNLNDLKRPAIKWGRYQHTHPEVSDLENWFLESGFGGLGVVCGRVSGLAVLDFDDPRKASEFRRLHPHLTETRIVESGTRHLPHYYYHVPDELSIHSRSAPGVDFRADGAYVVAPPTSRGDIQWRVLRDEPLHILSGSDLKAIWRFLASPVPEVPQNGPESLFRANSSQSFYPSPPSVVETFVVGSRRNSDASINDLLALYKGKLDGGRNNALFYVACIARDRGMAKTDVIRQLADAHARQSAQDGISESFQARYAEALRTIESVYQRLPRACPEVSPHKNREAVGIPTPQESRSPLGLLNSIREWLLSHGLAAAARMLDGLLLAGVEARATFTESQACVLLRQFRIGRRSIMVALKAILPDGQPLFEKVSEPLQTSPIPANAAIHLETGLKKCVLVTGANRVKTSGRPSAYYRLPDNETLTRRLGLNYSPVDPVSLDDLASPKTYRRALHRELVKRRPGSYSRQWLAERLGISKWTSRRYEAALSIVVHPMYSEQPLRWTNVEALVPCPIEDARPGTFLETEDGKRYPPLRAIAMHLLDAGHKVVHKTRIANHYSYFNSEGVGIPTPPIPAQTETAISPHSLRPSKDSYSHTAPSAFNNIDKVASKDEPDTHAAQEGVGIPTPPILDTQPSFWLCPNCLKTHIAADPPASCARCGNADWERVPDAIWRDQERLKIYWQTRWREKHPSAPRGSTPLVDSRRRRNSDAFRNNGLYQASHIDESLNQAAQQVAATVPGLCRINALRLVTRYGIHIVEKAINRLEQRRDIRNPAGFLVSLLKSEHLFYSKTTAKLHRRLVEDAAEWTQKMSESAFVDFLANAEDFISAAKSE